MTDRAGSTGRRAWPLLAALLLVAPGCSLHPGSIRRGAECPRPSTGPMTPTLGTDMRAVAPGRMVPPPAPGVDLL